MSEFSNKELRITTREGIIRNIKKALENKENIDGEFVRGLVDNYLIRFIQETFMGNLGRILKEEILNDMCGFTTIKDLIKDHKGLKKDIKRREKRLDKLIGGPGTTIRIDEELEDISQEMCAVNM